MMLWEAATQDWASGVRHLSAALTTLAFAGLLWRLVGKGDLLLPLGRLIVALLTVAELLFALGTARRAVIGGPLNEAQYVVIVHAVAILVVILAWDRLLLRRNKRPAASPDPTP